MPQWSQTTEWQPTSSINQGNAYTPADGVTADDMNAIIHNLIYLKTHGNKINIVSSDAYVSGTTLFLSKEVV